MGDPTLRMHPVQPANALTAWTNVASVQLSWTASYDSVLGYHVYRAADPSGPFTRLTGSLLTSTAFTDPAPLSGANAYMVRAVKLESTPSGTYYNASQGSFVTITWVAPPVRRSVRIDWVSPLRPGVAFGWTTVPGERYRVSGSTDFNSADWPDLTGDLISGSTSLSWTDYTANASSPRFYRVYHLQ